MLIFILGIMDILAGLSIFMLGSSLGPPVVWFFVLYLVAKSLPYLRSIASIIDIVVAIVFVFAILGYVNVFTYIGVLWLLQKGIISFLT